MAQTVWAIDGVGNDAKIARLALASLIGTSTAGGIVAPGALEINPKGTPDMHVLIKGGSITEGGCWVPGFTGSSGPYFFYNDTTLELLDPFPSGASQPRVDTVVARVYDKAVEGSGEKGEFEFLKGAEEPEANLTTLKGVAVVPKGALVIGYVEVKAKATAILAENIKNLGTLIGLQTVLRNSTSYLKATSASAGSGLAGRVVNTPYTPHAERTTQVGVEYQFSGSANQRRYGFTFLVPPGRTYEYKEVAAGIMAISGTAGGTVPQVGPGEGVLTSLADAYLFL